MPRRRRNRRRVRPLPPNEHLRQQVEALDDAPEPVLDLTAIEDERLFAADPPSRRARRASGG